MTELPYRIVFFGTPAFAAPILAFLAAHTNVVLVVSQPDRPSGRGCKMCKPAVKETAEKLGIEVIQPEIAKGRRFADRIAAYQPDFLITAAYGRILGKCVLDVPKKSALNVHASLLPKYRGAAPAAWAVLNGDAQSGVSIMKMEVGLDEGPVFQRVVTEIDPNETAGELLCRLSDLGAKTIVDTLRRFDSFSPQFQDREKATYARMLSKCDGKIVWLKDARALHNHVRGMSPWPSAFTYINGKPIRIHMSAVVNEKQACGKAGEVVSISKDGIDVACARGVLRLLELQAPGKKRMPAHAYLLGNPLNVGAILGSPAEAS